MKFGKEFSSQMVPEWQQAYMDYSSLKSCLKEIIRFKQTTNNAPPHAGAKNHHGGIHRKLTLYRAFSGLVSTPERQRHSTHSHDLEEGVHLSSAKTPGPPILVNTTAIGHCQTTFLMAAEEGGEYELVFFRRLDDEFNKVDKFYKEKVEEVLKEAMLLNKQMDALIAFRVKVENPEGWLREESTVEMTQLASDIATSAATLSASTPAEALSPSTPSGAISMKVRSEAHMEAIQEGGSSRAGRLEDDEDEEQEEIGASVSSESKVRVARPAPLDVLDRVKMNNTKETPLSTLEGVLQVAKKKELKFSRENLNKVEERLRNAFIVFYQKLRLLKSYRLLSRFVNSNGGNNDLDSPSQSELGDKSPVSLTNSSVSYAANMPPHHEPSSFLGLPPHYPRQSKGMMTSIGLDQFLVMNNHHTKPIESNLLRQSSSPAGMFTNLSDQNDYGSIRSLMNYTAEEENEESSSNSNGLRRHCSLSSRSPSLGMLSQIPEISNESMATNFQYSHWSDPFDNLSSLKRETEDDGKLFLGAQGLCSFLNVLAFSKILKKYDKITSRDATKPYMKMVDSSYLGSSDEVVRLMDRVEATFVKHFANANRAKGMNILRPKAKQERHRITFSTGFTAGCVFSLIVALVAIIRTRNILENDGQKQYMDTMFPLYSFFGFIVLHIIMYAANIYYWRRYRVNYSFIFGFKEGTELGYREVLLVGFSIGVFALLCVIANLDMEAHPKTKDYKALTELLPLFLLIALLIVLVMPFNIFYRSSRFFFLTCMLHCLAAPLYKVTLPDFFLGDQLTSQVQALRSIEFYICYYGWGDFRHRKNTCTTDTYNTFIFIIAVIPYASRLLQCLRRLVEENNPEQGYNGLKYFLTIVAVCLRTAYSFQKGQIAWRALAAIFSAIAAIYCTHWDFVHDWGLLNRTSKNRWLRDKLLIPQKKVYFIAMILNVLLIFAWIQTVLDFNFSFMHRQTMVTLVASLEIIRRGIWNFFRLENEHLNNVGKYRAFKSVPLPFNYDEDEDKDD